MSKLTEDLKVLLGIKPLPFPWFTKSTRKRLVEKQLLEFEVYVDEEGWAHDDEGNVWYVGYQHGGNTYGLRNQPPEIPHPSGKKPPSGRSFRAPVKIKPGAWLNKKDKKLLPVIAKSVEKSPDPVLQGWVKEMNTPTSQRKQTLYVRGPGVFKVMDALRKRGMAKEAEMVRPAPYTGGEWTKWREKLRWLQAGHLADKIVGSILDKIDKENYATDADLAVLYKALREGPETHWTMSLLKQLDDVSGGERQLKATAKLPKGSLPAKTSEEGSQGEMVDVIRQAIKKKSDPALLVVLKALEREKDWKKGAPDETLKKIRHELYKRGMKKEANLFR
jgi:hypothetical protein